MAKWNDNPNTCQTMPRKSSGSPYLPELTADSRVTATQARQDRIVVEIGDWFVIGTQENLESFYGAFGRLDPSAPRPRLFAVAGRQNTRWPVIKLRQSPQAADRQYGKPLLAGQIGTANYPNPQGSGPGQFGRRLFFQGTINPTRFVVHQPKLFQGRTIVDPTSGRLPAVRMFAPETETYRGQERSLTDADNVIRSQRALSYARPEAWPRHLRRYLEAVPMAIDAELRDAAREATSDAARNAARDAGVRIERSNRFQLREVETYWEFYSEDAPALVRDIAPVIAEMGKNASERPFSNAERGKNTEQNQISVRADLSGQRMLKVYAKTPTRIRFEVEHSEDFFRHLPSRQSHIQSSPGEWLPILAQLAILAAEGVNEALRRIGARVSANRQHRTPYDLLAHLVDVLEDAEKAREFASLLVANRRVVVGKDLAPRKQVLALVRRGVLESIRSTRGVYALAPDYANALAHLQAFRAPGVPRIRRKPVRSR